MQCIIVDAHNPKTLAQFWAEALGWKAGEGVNDVEIWIEPTCTWVVMADPEGNEFCVLREKTTAL